MRKALEDTFWLLEQWSKWARLSGEYDETDYPGMDPVRAFKGSTVSMPSITDHDAIIVDRLMARLIRRDSEMGGVTKTYFRYGGNLIKAAEVLRMNRHRANVLVSSGVAWIDACIDRSTLDWAGGGGSDRKI